MSCSNVIELQNISKVYNLYHRPIDRLLQMFPWNKDKIFCEEFWALKDINLQIQKGDVVGIVGQNGAGKSTLLQTICKTLTATSGTLHIEGKVSALLELGSGFNPEFTGRENVYMAGAIAGFTKEEMDQKYEEIVTFSGIGEHVNNPTKTYSSGMMVRLAFAVATSVEPEILIVDEALSVGDGAFARKSFDRIMELKNKGCTILFCSHSLYQVEVLCNKVMWLEHGQIKLFGEPSGVISSYQKFLDDLNANQNDESLVQTPQAATNSSSRIKKIRFFNEKDEDKNLQLISDQSTLNIEVLFSADLNLPKPTIGVLITDESLKNVTSCSTFFDKVDLEIDKNGNGSTVLSFPNIGLRKGLYHLEVYLMCENGIHIYDGIQAGEFEVVQTGSELGVVSLPRKWENTI